jgi:hypothetical protein
VADEPANPYAAPVAEISAAAPPPAAELTREEVEAFVGARRATFYWGRWRSPMQSGSIFAGFSWAAGFFNILWFLYRKMYREFAVLFVALVALSILTEVTGASGLDRIINLLAFVTAGSLGVGLYLRRARIVVAAARQVEPDLERRLALLRKKGGTSLLWPLLAAAILVGLSFLGLAASQ